MTEPIATEKLLTTEETLNYMLTNKKKIMGYIHRRINPIDKEDIFQDTLMSIIKSKTQLKVDHPVPYFKTMIKYNTRLYFETKKTQTLRGLPRSKNLADVHVDLNAMKNNLYSTRTPEVHLMQKQQLSIISDFISTLPPIQKKAFYSRFFEFKDGNEIAKDLDCTYMTAKSNYNLALAKLKKSEIKEQLSFINWGER